MWVRVRYYWLMGVGHYEVIRTPCILPDVVGGQSRSCGGGDIPEASLKKDTRREAYSKQKSSPKKCGTFESWQCRHSGWAKEVGPWRRQRQKPMDGDLSHILRPRCLLPSLHSFPWGSPSPCLPLPGSLVPALSTVSVCLSPGSHLSGNCHEHSRASWESTG